MLLVSYSKSASFVKHLHMLLACMLACILSAVCLRVLASLYRASRTVPPDTCSMLAGRQLKEHISG